MSTLGQQIRKLRKQLQQQLIETYSTGKFTHSEIAEMSGCNYGTLFKFYSQWKKKYDFPPPPNKRGKKSIFIESILRDNIESAYKEYQWGKSMAQIGEKYGGISREAVRQMFKKHGLKTRPAGGWKRKHNHKLEKHPEDKI